MAIGNEFILEWIDKVAKVSGLQMDPVTLADDVLLMAVVFDDEISFQQAMDSVVRALDQLVQGKVAASELVSNYNGWDSYHFQSQRTKGHRADLRVIFQNITADFTQVKGFGHRHLPA